jgi:hypothetical protein
VTRYSPLWQQDATYPAATDRMLIAAAFSHAGVTGMVPTAIPGQLAISISDGLGIVPMDPDSLTGGSYLCMSDDVETVQLDPAPPAGNSRMDFVVLQVRDSQVDLGGNNDWLFRPIAGAPTTGTPTLPALPALAIPIATCLVPGNAVGFPPAVLTDLRAPADPAGSIFVSLGRNGAYTVPSGNSQVFPWDTVVDDPLNLFDPNTFAFTAPIDGIYFVSVKLCAIGIQGSFIGVSLLRNSVLTYEGAAPYNAFGGGTAVHTFLSVSVRMAAGDYIQLTSNGNDPAQQLFGGAAQNYCNINYVARG